MHAMGGCRASRARRIGAAPLLAGCADGPTGPDHVISRARGAGDHATLVIQPTSATIEFDCAHDNYRRRSRSSAARSTSPACVRGPNTAGGHRVDEVALSGGRRYSGTSRRRAHDARVRLEDGQDSARIRSRRTRQGGVFKFSLSAPARI